jgi:hypothetical protein
MHGLFTYISLIFSVFFGGKDSQTLHHGASEFRALSVDLPINNEDFP